MSSFVLEISGAFALFTRPEFKVERLSYEAHTSKTEIKDLGRILYDMDFADPKRPEPIFFEAKMTNGTITI